MEFRYKDVVPKAEMERYLKKWTSLSQTHKSLVVAYDQIKGNHEKLAGIQSWNQAYKKHLKVFSFKKSIVKFA